MGFAQWFWRLFAVFAGLIVAHVLFVTWLISRQEESAAFPITTVWLSAAVAIAAGAVAMWSSLWRIMEPLSELSRQVRLTSGTAATPGVFDQGDDVGLITGAFDQMQRDLESRLDQIQGHSERLATVLRNMAEGVLAVGPDKTILLANDAGQALLDFATPSPLGRPLLEVTRARAVYEAVTQALDSDGAVEREFDAPGPVRRTLSLRATRLPGNPCPGVMIVLHDMTELRRLESLRSELVANVSHELKTPLAAIKGYAETLRLGAIHDPDHNLQFIGRIEEQADRLHELILDILHIARLESGQESFELVDVPIADLLDQCADQFSKAASARQIDLHVEPPPEVTVRCDEEGLRTIVNNLIDNAIKYTPAGGRIMIRSVASAATVTIAVEDTGIGIAERELSRIFERFYRVDRARSRELGGTGLGLSIVKHLAQAFGGSVSVESQLSHGSVFRVEMPRGASKPQG